MCGLVGAAGAIGFKEEKVVKQLLILDSLRGDHSTGIASVDSYGEIRIAKAVGHPFNLFETVHCEEIFRKSNRVLIGHNRFATTGAVTKRNAHPFEFDNIVGAHNGTLTNKHDIPEGNLYTVDSEALYNYIDKVGIEKAMEKVTGAWALTFYDVEKNTINFLRNKERPLYYVLDNEEKVVFWASEKWMLEVALGRGDVKHGPIHNLPEDMLITLEVDVYEKVLGKVDAFQKPKGKKVTGKKPYASQPTLLAPVSKTSTQHSSVTRIDGSRYDPDYVNKSGVLLHTGPIGRDTQTGDNYISCIDPDDVGKTIRLYFHKNDLVSTKPTGTKIRGNISGNGYGPGGQLYYKVSPWSIAFVLPDVNKEEKDKPHFFQPKLNGRLLSKAEFEDNHCQCDWCDMSISYGEDCYVYQQGAVCAGCMELPDVIDVVPGLANHNKKKAVA